MRRKQLVLNIGSNFISVMIGLFISFYITPFIVLSIGKEAYSFVTISNNFTSYMAILTIALTSMTSRFVTLKIHKNDMEAANDYYSTSFFTNLAIAALVSVICIILLIYLDKLINIPSTVFFDVRLLFGIMFLTFVINVSTTTFSVAAFSMNRLDVNSIISILGSIARMTVIFVAFRFFKPKVFYIGLSALVVILIQGSMNYFIGKKIMPALRISYKRVKLTIVRELFNSGIWNSFNQLSAVLLTGLDLLIANIMLGASASGTLAVAKTAPMALQALIAVVPTAFNPYLTILFAKANRDNFINELLYTLKFTSILIGIPIAGFIALSSVFFSLWIPTVANQQLTVLAILTMISMIASFSIMPLMYIFTITNKLKWPSIAIFIVGLVNIVLVYILIKTTDIGLYAIAGVSSFLEIFRCLIFVPLYASFCLNEKPTLFYSSILKSLGYMTILIIVYSSMALLIPIHSWLRLLLVAGLMAVIGLGIGIQFVLNADEKTKIKRMFIDFMHKMKSTY